MSQRALIMATIAAGGLPPGDPNLWHEIIIFGQSNAFGSNWSDPDYLDFIATLVANGRDVNTPLTRSFIVDKDGGGGAGALMPLALGVNQAAGMGIELAFAHLWEQYNPVGKLVIYKRGSPGAPIETFIKGQPGEFGYATLQEIINKGRNLINAIGGQTRQAKGVYLHQGESNPIPPDAVGHWSDSVMGIFDDFISDGMTTTGVPFVIGGLYSPITAVYNEMQTVANTYPNTYYNDNTTKYSADGTHLSAPSQWQMGEEGFADIYQIPITHQFTLTAPFI